MKIFTKDVLKKDRLLFLCQNAAVLPEAELKNEEFFDSFFDQRSKPFYLWEVCTAFYDLVHKTFPYEDFSECRETMQIKFNNRIEELTELINLLPEYILEQVADIRIFALGAVSQSVKNQLELYAAEHVSEIEFLRAKVEENNLSAAKKLSKPFNANNLEDMALTAINPQDDYIDLYIEKKVILRVLGGKIIEKDFDNINASTDDGFNDGFCNIVGAELYADDSECELHLLLDNRNGFNKLEYCYLTIKGKDINLLKTP